MVKAFIHGAILPALPHLVFGSRVSQRRSSLLLGWGLGAIGVHLSPPPLAWDYKTEPPHLAFPRLRSLTHVLSFSCPSGSHCLSHLPCSCPQALQKSTKFGLWDTTHSSPPGGAPCHMVSESHLTMTANFRRPHLAGLWLGLCRMAG